MTTQTLERPPARHAAPAPAPASGRPSPAAPKVWAVARIALGFVFLWAFLDKLFGLGFATPSARAWINGGSPSTGFLRSVEGPFAGIFNAMAGNAFVDVLFMAGLLGIGAALILGIGMRVAAVSATLMLVFMWAAALPLKSNPFLDDHLVYALLAIGLACSNAGDTWGLGRTWSRTTLVKRLPFLR